VLLLVCCFECSRIVLLQISAYVTCQPLTLSGDQYSNRVHVEPDTCCVACIAFTLPWGCQYAPCTTRPAYRPVDSA
jgi:hypothetical protein